MKSSRDPDTLRIPAFLRKKNIAARTKRPLVLTALDRKKALDAKKKKRPGVSHERKIAIRAKATAKATIKPARAKRTKPKIIKMPHESPASPFSAPLFESSYEPVQKCKPVGTMTHYYDKIKVGVIKLSKLLSVGDTIAYEIEGAESPYEQIVESMEINRQPVFRAGKGKEIGLKLRKMPKVGRAVTKT